MRTLAIASLPNLTLEERLTLLFSSIEVEELLLKGNRREFDSLLRWCDKKGNKWVSYGDEEYPPQLRSIEEAPFLLTYQGSLTMEGLGLSIVGAQYPNRSLISAASKIAYQCSARGHTVVSGFERGIPLLVHKAAFKSWALLPFGIEHLSLPKLVSYIIEQGGALISEYHPDASPLKWRYHYSSRLVGALSPVTAVFGAQWRTTASLAANYALDYGRDVVVANEGQKAWASKALLEAGAPLISSLDEITHVTQIDYGRL